MIAIRKGFEDMKQHDHDGRHSTQPIQDGVMAFGVLEGGGCVGHDGWRLEIRSWKLEVRI
jgi:hypothetical protein